MPFENTELSFPIYRVRIKEPHYPALLKEISDPPGLLYCRGKLNESKPALAIVGSRKMGSYGKAAVERIVSGLAGSNITIVSGLAFGIDALAHQAALDYGLHTIAVLGSPVSNKAIYPKSNFNLAQKILRQGGALISEFEEGSPIYKTNFPKRNRIIAGLCNGCLVVEAAEKSGALITADLALDFNRELFAVPGSIFSEQSAGTNKLIKQGACPVTNAKDIIERLDLEGCLGINGYELFLNIEEKIVYENLGNSVISADELAIKAGLKIGQISAALSELELRSLVKSDGQGNFYKVRFS